MIHLSHDSLDRLEPAVVEVIGVEVEQAAGLRLIHCSPRSAHWCLLWSTTDRLEGRQTLTVHLYAYVRSDLYGLMSESLV